MPSSFAHGSYWHSTLSSFSSLIYSQWNKARSSFASRCRASRNNQRTRGMDRSNSRFFESAGNAENPAQQGQPPGVDQPALINSFSHGFSGSLPGATQPDISGLIRRPAGRTPIYASKLDNLLPTLYYLGSTTPVPLSDALSRAIAADAALHHQLDAPPPGSSPPVTHEPGGCLGGGSVDVPPPAHGALYARPAGRQVISSI